jgi:transposase
MMPARYVKPYVKRNKNDAADAEAICEAITRPTMRFVPMATERPLCDPEADIGAVDRECLIRVDSGLSV